jgi:hypothetical protein
VQLVDLVILYWKALSSVHYMFRHNWPSSGENHIAGKAVTLPNTSDHLVILYWKALSSVHHMFGLTGIR